ncbi:hypothetical protein U1Q18_002780, partial [Sarracenia purpurea var. burkii]
FLVRRILEHYNFAKSFVDIDLKSMPENGTLHLEDDIGIDISKDKEVEKKSTSSN